MDLKDLLGQAFGIATSTYYFVQVDSEELKKLTYLELGIFLNANTDRIETIYIKMKEED